MKICITSLGPNLDSPIDPRFGRARYFLLLDENGELKKVLPNSGVNAIRGAGIAAAQQIVQQGVEVLITGNIGPNAFGALMASKIRIFLGLPGVSSSVREIFNMWRENKLSQVQAPSVPGHFGKGPSFGRRGWGQGGWRGQR